MSLTSPEVARLLFAVLLLLASAHGFGYLLARLGQPRVVGEILGGVVLGPTLFGALAPAAQHALFEEGRVTPPVLGAIVQFGLQLLMFTSGAEFRATFAPHERRVAIAVSIAGTILPFLGGLAMLLLWDPASLLGTAGNMPALVIVLAVGVAVTSIPVISRIMIDLGIIATPFARVVLAAAVIEDLVLYVALAIALGLVSAKTGAAFGVPALLKLGAAGPLAGSAYYVASSLVFFGVSLAIGPRVFRAVAASRFDVLRRSNPTGALLAFLLGMTALALVAGIASMFGAFLAGAIVGIAHPDDRASTESRAAIKSFALAFFVPIYFAVVGLRLDLIHDFDPRFFFFFATYACAWKAAAVYGGARLAGERAVGARNLAVAMNARGGPGIVLASVALDAGIVSRALYASLVVLALVTSILAGAWLERQVKAGRELL